MTIWIAGPIEHPKPETYRVVGVRACSCGFCEADLLVRFWLWIEASTYLDRLTESGLLSAGRIERYVPGIGWVVADTDPEETT